MRYAAYPQPASTLTILRRGKRSRTPSSTRLAIAGISCPVAPRPKPKTRPAPAWFHSEKAAAAPSKRTMTCRQPGMSASCSRAQIGSKWVSPGRFKWVSPGRFRVGVPGALRFDTRFFVAVMPPNQSASGHRRETVGGDWISPAAALGRFDDGDWQMIFPTLTTLQVVEPYHTVDALFEAVSAGRHAMEMTPELHLQGMQYS